MSLNDFCVCVFIIIIIIIIFWKAVPYQTSRIPKTMLEIFSQGLRRDKQPVDVGLKVIEVLTLLRNMKF